MLPGFWGELGFGCVFGLVVPSVELVGFTRLLWTQAGVPVLLEALAVSVGRYDGLLRADRVRARKERSTAGVNEES